MLRCSGFSLQWLLLLRSMGSRVHGLQELWLVGWVAPCHVGSLFPDQGLSLCPPCWQVVSQPVDHQCSAVMDDYMKASCLKGHNYTVNICHLQTVEASNIEAQKNMQGSHTGIHRCTLL